MDTITRNRLLRLPEVSKLTSLGKSTINLWVGQGKFPAPTALSSTIKVWRLQDVEDWINQAFGDLPKEAPHDAQSKAHVYQIQREVAGR